MTITDALVTPETVTAAAALLGVLGGVGRWSAQRRAESKAAEDKETTRFVIPFLVAANDLQSRLYNIVEQSPWEVFRYPGDGRQFAVETLFLASSYFGEERRLLRSTPLGRDATVIRQSEEIREEFSQARRDTDRDPWCLFRVRQQDWARIAQPGGEVLTLAEFARALEGMPTEAGPILESFDQGAPEPRSLARLADVQVRLVALLDTVESRIDRRPPWYHPIRRTRTPRFTLFPKGRGAARLPVMDDETCSPSPAERG